MFRTNRDKNPELYKLITPHHKRLVAKAAGVSYKYVSCILDPDDKRFNPIVVAMCEAVLISENALMAQLEDIKNQIKAA